MNPRLLLVGLLAALSLPGTVHAHALIGRTWPTGDIPIRLQLDATATAGMAAFPLNDGAASWNSVADAALTEWNRVLARSRFVGTASTSRTAAFNDGVTNVFFASNAYGTAFPSRVLAVTFNTPLEGDIDQVRTIEADVIVNTAITWNSYRGAHRSSPADLRRVLVHEFGHAIGLDHPDEAEPVQSVTAIMNSTIGDVEVPTADDRAGIAFLYNTPFLKPVFTTQPVSRTLPAGSSTTLAIGIDGRAIPVTHEFRSNRWYFKAVGAADYEMLFTIHRPGSLDFPLLQAADSGSYYFRSVTPDDTVDSNVATLSVTPVTPTPATALANLSTRGIADTGVNSMIVGFAVAGPRAKRVLLRSVGPTLGSAFSVPGILPDPVLILKNSSSVTVATSTPIWDQSTDVAAIRETSDRVGAFALAAGSRDAVILATLPPGTYTAQTTSPTSRSGVVLVEAYDADETRDPASRLTNLSTRGFVSTGADILIAGFVVTGPGPRNYLIRVAGDTLKSFGVNGTLDDPYLKIYRGDGTLARELDDWDSPASSQPALRTAFNQVGAFALSDRQETAMLVTLPPGNYSAHVSGLDNGGSTNPRGVALVEVYEMP